MKSTIRTLIISTIIATTAMLPLLSYGKSEEAAGARSGYSREIFQKIIQPYRQISDYKVDIQAKVRMPGFRIPDFTATVYFKKPDKFHVEARGVAPIPRSTGIFNPLQFDPERNRITFERQTDLEGTPAQVYRVEPRSNDAPIRFYTLWIGGNPLRILQVDSLSYRGTRVLVKMTYPAVQSGNGEGMLPEKAHIHISFSGTPVTPDNSTAQAKETPFSRGMTKVDELSGEGDIYISYSSWQINTGLEDSLFTNQPKR
jgi:hypothetical protein